MNFYSFVLMRTVPNHFLAVECFETMSDGVCHLSCLSTASDGDSSFCSPVELVGGR